MKRILASILVLVLATLACNATPTEPRELNLYPSATPGVTQTPVIVEITTTPEPPVVVVVSTTPEPSVGKCVTASVAVHLRPSPSNDNYPVMALPNGAEVTDLGGRSEKWMFVQYQDKQGWVFGDYVDDCE